MYQGSQSRSLYQDAASGRFYRLTIESGYYWQTFADDGTRRRGGPVRPAAGSGTELSSRSGVQSDAQQTEPRSVPQGNQSGYPNANSSSSPPAPTTYTWGGQDPNATPTPANYLSLGLGQLSLNDQGSSSQNYGYHNLQTGTDQYGTSFASADGPTRRITDPNLLKHNVVASKILMGTRGISEKLDKDFKKREKPKKFFKVGKVFLVLWSEPCGDFDENNQTDVTRVRFGDFVYSKVRRFVVVREGHNSCSAVPILTYKGRGVAAPAVKKCDHVVIHTSKYAPDPSQAEKSLRYGEPGIRQGAIRVDPFDSTDKLDVASRINFGKVYTIEHSLKVKGFGMVVDVPDLQRHFWEVWAASAQASGSFSASSSGLTRQARQGSSGGTTSAGRPHGKQIEGRSKEIQDRQRKYQDDRRNKNRADDENESNDDETEDSDDEDGEGEGEEGEDEESDEDEDEDEQTTGR